MKPFIFMHIFIERSCKFDSITSMRFKLSRAPRLFKRFFAWRLRLGGSGTPHCEEELTKKWRGKMAWLGAMPLRPVARRRRGIVYRDLHV